MMKFLAVIVAMVLPGLAYAGDTTRVLFIGNSYTYMNDLPLMLKNVAASTGDVVIYDGNLIGGFSLQDHSTQLGTLTKIAAGGWDYVVLQEQSQRPSFSDNQVLHSVYPYAKHLDSLIRLHNPCAETVFYNTWGRKNGDAQNCPLWPPVCTYIGMDSLLRLRYGIMAADNNAIVSPVGPVWRRIRGTAPLIDLYDPDESHPSVAGTYAAACAFYAVILRKNPTAVTYNSTLSATNASIIRTAAKAVAFDSLTHWRVGTYDPDAAFTRTVNGATVTFTNASQRATSYLWMFGNGQTSSAVSPSHVYSASGTYNVKLIASRCGRHDTASQLVTVTGQANISTFPKEQSFTAYRDGFGTVHLLTDGPLSKGTTISIFSLDGRLATQHLINSDLVGEVQIPLAHSGQLYVLSVAHPKSGVYWRQLLR
jgi:PKD repeat protein